MPQPLQVQFFRGETATRSREPRLRAWLALSPQAISAGRLMAAIVAPAQLVRQATGPPLVPTTARSPARPLTAHQPSQRRPSSSTRIRIPSPTSPTPTQLTRAKASLPRRSANAPPRGTQLHQRCVVYAYTSRGAQRCFAGSSASTPSHTDPSACSAPRRGSVVVVGVHTSRRVASEPLSALARSSSELTSSRRTRKARPTRTAGRAPLSIQLRIVCAVTWNCSATWGTVRSCGGELGKAAEARAPRGRRCCLSGRQTLGRSRSDAPRRHERYARRIPGDR